MGMENQLRFAGFFAFLGFFCVIRFPEGVPKIGKTDGFWVFITADLTAACISKTVMLLQITVGPKTWKKVEEHAKKAMCVASIFEAIAIHQVGLILLSHNFWLKFTFNCFSIGFIGFICVMFILYVAKGGKRDKVEMVQ